uniref:Uncharacterized protein n=1 Tax=Arundo donax TaxID=35708 RepID=A0A0A9GBL8_ARUDO
MEVLGLRVLKMCSYRQKVTPAQCTVRHGLKAISTFRLEDSGSNFVASIQLTFQKQRLHEVFGQVNGTSNFDSLQF